jgi:hypothetical protein
VNSVHVSQVVSLFCIVYVLAGFTRVGKCGIGQVVSLRGIHQLACRYGNLCLYIVCMYVRIYVCVLCAVFINSPAKARGKRGREGGEANEGVRER